MTNFTQSINFYSLAAETRKEVVSYVLDTDNNLHCRLVCKDFLYSANQVIKEKWLTLVKEPPAGPVAMSFAIERIHKPFLMQDGMLQENLNYLHLFRELNLEWKKRKVTIPNGELKISDHHFFDLQTQFHQQCLDYSLSMMWDKIWPELTLWVGSFPNTTELRNWLNNPNSAQIRSVVSGIDLCDLGIRYVPIEICCFPNITFLRLCQNHIDIFPSFIGTLTHLRGLSLKDNDIQELPKNISGWTHLRVIDLSENSIKELPENFPNWTHLRMINLKNNPLSQSAFTLIDEWKENVKNLRDGSGKPVVYT